VRTRLCVALATGWLCIAAVAPAQAQDAGVPTDREVEQAVTTLKADPNLAQERKTKTLRLRTDEDKKPSDRSSFAEWLSSFFSWVGGLSRVLIWAVLAVLAGLLLVLVFRLFKDFEGRDLTKAVLPPTHVRDLDIRPESLPDDIGAAALDLWRRGEHRGALALLYRGLLSRLVHSFEVPIQDSTTEGDCLRLAAKHLQAERSDYVARLIRIWQRATYGGRDAQTEEVEALCADFAKALATPPDRSPGAVMGRTPNAASAGAQERPSPERRP